MIKPKINKKQINRLLSINRQKNLSKKEPGDAPGTIIHTGQKVLDEILITVHDFDETHYLSEAIDKISDSNQYLESKSKTWLQVRGLHNIEKLKNIWNYFNLHPLVQEDIVFTSQRPKIESYNDYIFIVIRSLKTISNSNDGISNEQISIVLGKNYVLSFQETDNPVFDPIIKRLQNEGTRLRKLGPDYLTYALIDCVVDHYTKLLDIFDDLVTDIEDDVILNPQKHHLQQIHALRCDLGVFRKSIWALRDGINSLLRDESPLVSDEVKLFTRDVYDHLVQVIESLDSSREMVYSLYDMYMSNLSNKMNEVMRVLTIIATIFIPLTFIAGVYGMNFNPETSPWNMPELNWYWGYPFSIALMIAMVVIMIVFFKRKKWL
ncbi:MAG TPA: magnesium/cobalt transporter CorA [Bacteroidetes bacterium]|nr:magnesium/cobalt transporter CorA [Bacteroidota bacterium]